MFSSLNLCLFIFIFHLLPFVNLYRSWCFRHNESERRAVKWNLDDVHSLYFSLVDSGNTTTTGKEIFAFTAIKFFFSHNFFFGPHDEQICLGDYRVSFISSTLSLYLSLFCLNQCERLNTNFEKGAPRINTTKKSWKIIFFSAQMKKKWTKLSPVSQCFLVHFVPLSRWISFCRWWNFLPLFLFKRKHASAFQYKTDERYAISVVFHSALELNEKLHISLHPTLVFSENK